MAFELVEFCEPAPQPGEPFAGTSQTVIDTYDVEAEAIAVGRDRWTAMRADTDNVDVMWWIVRRPGETLARWIADKGTSVEQILDLRTNELMPVRQ